MAGFDLPVRAIREQMASAIDCIVQLTRLRDGTRRITHISEVQGMEGDVITLQDIFLFDFGMGVDEHGKFRGHLKATGTRPKFAEKLAGPGHPPRPRGVPARGVRPTRQRCPMTDRLRPPGHLRRAASRRWSPPAWSSSSGRRPSRRTSSRRPASSSARSTAPTRTNVDVDLRLERRPRRPRGDDHPRGRPARPHRPARAAGPRRRQALARHRARHVRVDGRRTAPSRPTKEGLTDARLEPR